MRNNALVKGNSPYMLGSGVMSDSSKLFAAPTRENPRAAGFIPACVNPPSCLCVPFLCFTCSRRPRQRPYLAELARQLLPGSSAVPRAVHLAADTAGVDQFPVGGMDRKVPERAVGGGWHPRRLPGGAAIGGTSDSADST